MAENITTHTLRISVPDNMEGCLETVASILTNEIIPREVRLMITLEVCKTFICNRSELTDPKYATENLVLLSSYSKLCEKHLDVTPDPEFAQILNQNETRLH